MLKKRNMSIREVGLKNIIPCSRRGTFLSMGLYPSDRLFLLTCSSFWAWDDIPQIDFSYWHIPLLEHGIISLRPTSLIDMFL
jgi:hypothetical protein